MIAQVYLKSRFWPQITCLSGPFGNYGEYTVAIYNKANNSFSYKTLITCVGDEICANVISFNKYGIFLLIYLVVLINIIVLNWQNGKFAILKYKLIIDCL